MMPVQPVPRRKKRLVFCFDGTWNKLAFMVTAIARLALKTVQDCA
jgi:uncharacterized protein (DUF2235 family)